VDVLRLSTTRGNVILAPHHSALHWKPKYQLPVRCELDSANVLVMCSSCTREVGDLATNVIGDDTTIKM
jgi:hypothetical protein